MQIGKIEKAWYQAVMPRDEAYKDACFETNGIKFIKLDKGC